MSVAIIEKMKAKKKPESGHLKKYRKAENINQ
jgi:hypothetical protein